MGEGLGSVRPAREIAGRAGADGWGQLVAKGGSRRSVRAAWVSARTSAAARDVNEPEITRLGFKRSLARLYPVDQPGGPVKVGY